MDDVQPTTTKLTPVSSSSPINANTKITLDSEGVIVNPILDIMQRDKEQALLYRYRRHEDWTENYLLYRDKVILNRLIQRQSVNVPLMKYTIQTLLKDIDEPPTIYFKNGDNDDQKEVFYNTYWEHCAKENKLIIKDIIDKKHVLLYGRSFKKLNIKDGIFFFEVRDPQHILVDRMVDPSNLDSARFIIDEHNYLPLSDIEKNPVYESYDKNAIRRLKLFYATNQGLVKSDENLMDVVDANKRLQQMGVIDINNPVLGETYVEIAEHFRFQYSEDAKCNVIFVTHIAEGTEVLCNIELYKILGDTSDDYWYNHYPYVSWGTDPEGTDFWSDGVADVIRTPNKVLNSYFSQMVENRTLRNFGMNYYNSSNEKFIPQTFSPVPWGWYPVPGNPKDVVQHVDIPALEDSLEDMNFIIGLMEKATAATATSAGDIDQDQQHQITLGQVQLALANAQKRVKAMAIFYNDAWLEFGHKYVKLLEGAGNLLDPVTVQKKGRNGKKTYTKVISPDDWESKSPYITEVQIQAEKEQENSDQLQRLSAVQTIMPDNQPLQEIYKKKALEFANLTPTETKEVLDFEKQKVMATPPNNPLAAANSGPAQPQGVPLSPGAPQQQLPAPQPQPMQPQHPIAANIGVAAHG